MNSVIVYNPNFGENVPHIRYAAKAGPSTTVTIDIQDLVLQATGAEKANRLETVQRLWSGYGEIVRYALYGADRPSAIVKHVCPPQRSRVSGRAADWMGHLRKLRSYEVETAWYARWSGRCGEACRVPSCLAFESEGYESVLVLEDLDAAGFSYRRAAVTETELHACLRWLADFHATFIGERPEGLWPTGTYWHLDTRPDELNALSDIQLKSAAWAIDRTLRGCGYQTLVHGDAKLANFCFSANGERVAAVDFQYVGGGCGIKDVAYFIDSCLDGEEPERLEQPLLDCYFAALGNALRAKRKPVDPAAVEQAWRPLYPVAWTDFHRFLKGWSPGRWDRNSYSERLARQVIHQLQNIPGKDDALIRE